MQPVLFHAVVLALACMGRGHGTNLMLAWAYVALRVLHSLCQVLVNHIPTR